MDRIEGVPDDPFEPPPIKTDKLDAIAETLGILCVMLILFSVLVMSALWRILYELQRG